MRSTLSALSIAGLISLTLSLSACGDDDESGPPADGGSDAASMSDGGTTIDAEATEDSGSEDGATPADGSLPDDGSAPDDGGGDSGVAASLTMSCETNGARCDRSDEEIQSCLDGVACVETLIDPELIDDLIDCQSTIDCETPDDECFAMVAENVTTTEAEAFRTACAMRDSECGESFDAVPCVLGVIVRPSLRSSAMACLEEACDDIEGCFQALTPVECQ